MHAITSVQQHLPQTSKRKCRNVYRGQSHSHVVLLRGSRWYRRCIDTSARAAALHKLFESRRRSTRTPARPSLSALSRSPWSIPGAASGHTRAPLSTGQRLHGRQSLTDYPCGHREQQRLSGCVGAAAPLQRWWQRRRRLHWQLVRPPCPSPYKDFSAKPYKDLELNGYDLPS
jgi:hypothetical protein